MDIKTEDQLKDTTFLLRMPTDQFKLIKRYAKKNGLTMSKAIRLILDEHMQLEERKKTG